MSIFGEPSWATRVEKTLAAIVASLKNITNRMETIMSDLSAVQAAVTNSATVEQSAITLLQELSAQITANLNDPAALQALADSINSDSTALAAAVTANTPATPAPAPAPAPGQ